MSLIKLRVKQLKEYLEIQRDESQLSGKLVKNYKEKNKKTQDYEDFKKSLIYKIDTLFHEGKTKIVIRPNSSKLYLYEKLIKDTEFKRYYDCEVKAGNDLEIRMKEF